MHTFLDINVDVGEGLNNEAQFMPFISSCNIACGGHAGDFEIMTKNVKLAKQHHVKIGAHPSFPDKTHFGREIIEISSANLYTTLKKQIRSLLNVLIKEHLQLHHIKPHGALYNLAAKDKRTANIIIEVVKSIAYPIKLYAPYGSVIAKLASEQNIPVTFEAFADRHYNHDLSLVSRTNKNAVIIDTDKAIKHVEQIILGKVKTINGIEVKIKADTFCVHGDNPNAIQIIKGLKEHFG
ncbi:5-oxoprolinase subunit PxpA [Yeosuana sp. MJ-SS3]|uniref:5-oxoprolinase subunit PxpA n=1 Tax=Gilvirhabdus luticola TaxID=3079858 RepID=A0ABU3U7G6_9FLAO|nr:5-oxoprolinase subunit PxpA [Yeosuana sp. MJ-SS3]MDU8886259.1 5-oxoprolinase subunit PxpA [Yeosuana sp. MJ-SS3]